MHGSSSPNMESMLRPLRVYDRQKEKGSASEIDASPQLPIATGVQSLDRSRLPWSVPLDRSRLPRSAIMHGSSSPNMESMLRPLRVYDRQKEKGSASEIDASPQLPIATGVQSLDRSRLPWSVPLDRSRLPRSAIMHGSSSPNMESMLRPLRVYDRQKEKGSASEIDASPQHR